ncbi:YciI family protein [Sciscionella sediminilitoris]|uniref:YciI family protein n=1 Tax=Sciscionella sediminilitoris TaxID=1445613 RepID=UPI0004DF47DE|nr:YciI family protein [Sciscionella sp. SE31]
MYVVKLTYPADLTEIDARLSEHVAWLEEQYASERLLASGRQEPRLGGVLLFASIPRTELDAALARDPFAGVAEYEVTKFLASKTHDALAAFRDEQS